ncbi:nitroreductase [Acidovorax sp. SRB_14]|uniref:nitroreductase family protein n=1 Tax=Acidovorax sp. SRB_14 TaxID=1962699 RepID=UPI0020B10A45|nr:nitroreductase [Acidovorax sp. SRB_14]
MDACAPMVAPVEGGTPGELAAVAATLIQARQTILPKRLAEPAPPAAEFAQIVAAAGQAPDHGQILPWRLVRVPQAQRGPLAEVFAAALLGRDARATPEQVAQARDKAYRSPELLLVVVDGERGDPQIDLHERIVSAGCAVQNMLLMATALGYGSALTSGKALKSAGLRTLFGLGAGEHALCFLSLGTVQSRKRARLRPVPTDYLRTLGGEPPDEPSRADPLL